jgi:hypothetical protein
MMELRELVGERAFIMAKIEKPSAIEKLDEIIALSDGVMVARGDLGVELMHEDVPILQRQIIDKCRARCGSTCYSGYTYARSRTLRKMSLGYDMNTRTRVMTCGPLHACVEPILFSCVYDLCVFKYVFMNSFCCFEVYDLSVLSVGMYAVYVNVFMICMCVCVCVCTYIHAFPYTHAESRSSTILYTHCFLLQRLPSGGSHADVGIHDPQPCAHPR